eukprot:jgi/Orpsp1_1/1189928/evm.model.d7180000075517.1
MVRRFLLFLGSAQDIVIMVREEEKLEEKIREKKKLPQKILSLRKLRKNPPFVPKLLYIFIMIVIPNQKRNTISKEGMSEPLMIMIPISIMKVIIMFDNDSEFSDSDDECNKENTCNNNLNNNENS